MLDKDKKILLCNYYINPVDLNDDSINAFLNLSERLVNSFDESIKLISRITIDKDDKFLEVVDKGVLKKDKLIDELCEKFSKVKSNELDIDELYNTIDKISAIRKTKTK